MTPVGAGANVSVAEPYLGEVGVIGLVPAAWGGPWQPRQHVLTRLARYFNVVWVNPARGWRRSWFRPTAAVRDLDVADAAGAGFSIYQPEVWLPRFFWPRILDTLTTRERLRRARRELMRRGCRKFILYVWRPEYAPALDLVPHDVNCYHIDDEYSFADVEQPLDERERWLIERADQVFVHSPALLEKKGHLNPRTQFIPNGVDYRVYAASWPEPPDMRDIPHPRVGYVGLIKKQLDLVLLLTLAQRHTDWAFVFVGPQMNLDNKAVLVDQLRLLPNVFFLGGKAVSSLPAYVQHVDACMLSYLVNDYTKFIYPLKLHEYLATGRAVVGTPIRSLWDFSHVVTLARTADEWSRALTDALSAKARSEDLVAARQAVARQHDWETLVRQIAECLCARLGAEWTERLAQAPAVPGFDEPESTGGRVSDTNDMDGERPAASRAMREGPSAAAD